jgi:hypothetical protein
MGCRGNFKWWGLLGILVLYGRMLGYVGLFFVLSLSPFPSLSLSLPLCFLVSMRRTALSYFKL